MSCRIAFAAALAALSLAAGAQATLYADFEPGFSMVQDDNPRPGEWRAMTSLCELTSEYKTSGQQSARVQGAGLLYEFDNRPLYLVYPPYESKLFQVDLRPAGVRQDDPYEQLLGQVAIRGNFGGSEKELGLRFFVGVDRSVQVYFSLTNPYNAADPSNIILNTMQQFSGETWYTYTVLMDYHAMSVTQSLKSTSGDVLVEYTYDVQASVLYSMRLMSSNDRAVHFDSLYIGAVPEPSTAATVMSIGAMAILSRRRQKGSA